MAEEPAGPGRPAPGTATVAARASNASAFLQGGGELGALDPRQGLVAHAARPARELAAEPEDHPRHPAQLPLPHVRVLGAGAHQDLQRRLPADHRPQAPVGAGPAGPRGLAGDLERHRAARGPRPRRRPDLLRRPDAVHGAQRVPRGGLLHVLLQPRARRIGRRRRHVLRLHRDDGARASANGACGRCATSPSPPPMRGPWTSPACDRPRCWRRAPPTSRSR